MNLPVYIDIIILSYAKDEERRKLTQQTIATLMASEAPSLIKFNVVVVESMKSIAPFQFENSTTIYPNEKFGFHKYLNIGIKATTSPYVCLCNNDLIFHENWATEILKVMENDPELLSAHPCLPGFKRDENANGDDLKIANYFGVLFGWCIFTQRKLFDIIGLLDEKFTFWYADYDYAYTLKKHGLKNQLIESSVVEHLGSGSWTTMNKKENLKLTQLPRIYFSYKWKHHSYMKFLVQLFLNKTKLAFMQKRSED